MSSSNIILELKESEKLKIAKELELEEIELEELELKKKKKNYKI
jgi:hypothetical protein